MESLVSRRNADPPFIYLGKGQCGRAERSITDSECKVDCQPEGDHQPSLTSFVSVHSKPASEFKVVESHLRGKAPEQVDRQQHESRSRAKGVGLQLAVAHLHDQERGVSAKSPRGREGAKWDDDVREESPVEQLRNSCQAL